MRVKKGFFNKVFFNIGNGETTRFWEDTWLGNLPLQQKYPSLYNIAHRKNVSVHDVLNGAPLNMTFRRGLIGDTGLTSNDIFTVNIYVCRFDEWAY